MAGSVCARALSGRDKITPLHSVLIARAPNRAPDNASRSFLFKAGTAARFFSPSISLPRVTRRRGISVSLNLICREWEGCYFDPSLPLNLPQGSIGRWPISFSVSSFCISSFSRASANRIAVRWINYSKPPLQASRSIHGREGDAPYKSTETDNASILLRWMDESFAETTGVILIGISAANPHWHLFLHKRARSLSLFTAERCTECRTAMRVKMRTLRCTCWRICKTNKQQRQRRRHGSENFAGNWNRHCANVPVAPTRADLAIDMQLDYLPLCSERCGAANCRDDYWTSTAFFSFFFEFSFIGHLISHPIRRHQ